MSLLYKVVLTFESASAIVELYFCVVQFDMHFCFQLDIYEDCILTRFLQFKG